MLSHQINAGDDGHRVKWCQAMTCGGPAGGNRRIIMRAYAAFAIMLLFGIYLDSVSSGTAPSDS